MPYEYQRVLKDLKINRDRVLSGEINCIPLPFRRYRSTWAGIEQGSYIIVTANSKVGKSQITDYITLYSTILYAYRNRGKLRVKIFYFTLEMSKTQKYRQFMSFLLYLFSKGELRYSPKDLRSLDIEHPLPEHVLNLLSSKEYIELYKFFEECVTFIDDIRNPYGIYKLCKDYSMEHGTMHRKAIKIENPETGMVEERMIDDYYEPEDPEAYNICIVDHYRLFSCERGENLKETINLWSSKYAVLLRNKYKWTIVGVQQQAAKLKI